MAPAEPIMSRACCTTWSCAVCCKKERAKYPAATAPAPNARIKIKLNFKRRRIGRTLYLDRCNPHALLIGIRDRRSQAFAVNDSDVAGGLRRVASVPDFWRAME